MSTFTGSWNYPTPVRFGPGTIQTLPSSCIELGIRRPLLVTDPGVASLPISFRTIALQEEAGIPTAIFSGIKANPTEQNIMDGVEAYQQGQHDGVLAFGGGSALDAGKAIALMVGQNRPLFDFEDREDWWTRVDEKGMAPVIAIPTTSGTGSEVGRATVITDPKSATKKIVFHPKMLPSRVICDPELTLDLPPRLTAATGMDALSHALEAWCAPGFHPMADGIALEAILRVHGHLISAYRQGDNLESRAEMMVASLMGATAFQKGLGAMHAIAHPVGARWDAHHGTINAIVMPYVLKYNFPLIQDRLTRLARAMQLPVPTADAFIDWVKEIRSTLEIPETLSAIGVAIADVPSLVPQVIADPSAGTNPRTLECANVHALLEDCIRGA